MRVTQTDHGWYCDARPDGRVVHLVQDSHLSTDTGRVELPHGQNLLYLDLAPSGPAFAGVGNRDDLAWVWNGSDWVSQGVAAGQRPILYGADGGLFIVRESGPPPTGADGWRYLDDNNQPVPANTSLADPARRIYQFIVHQGVTVAQGGAGTRGEDPIVVLIDGTRRLLAEGRCRMPKFRLAGDLAAISFYREDTGQAFSYWLTRAELAALPISDDQPVDQPPVVVTPPVTPEPPKEPGMRLPDFVQANVNDLYRAHQDLANGTDDQRRQLTRMVAEQTVFDQPLPAGQRWGHKSAGTGRPPSKDAIAKEDGAHLLGWDLFNGTTRAPNDHPESQDITGQQFIPVDGVNHLSHGAAPGPQPPPVTPGQPGGTVSLDEDTRALLSEIRASNAQQEELLQDVVDELRGLRADAVKAGKDLGGQLVGALPGILGGLGGLLKKTPTKKPARKRR